MADSTRQEFRSAETTGEGALIAIRPTRILSIDRWVMGSRRVRAMAVVPASLNAIWARGELAVNSLTYVATLGADTRSIAHGRLTDRA